jgi:hypothetical protein
MRAVGASARIMHPGALGLTTRGSFEQRYEPTGRLRPKLGDQQKCRVPLETYRV